MYEAHVTISYEDFKSNPEAIIKEAAKNMFKPGKLFMEKDDGLKQSTLDAFFTTKATAFRVVHQNTIGFLTLLKLDKIHVTRWKIESTILDSKYGDTIAVVEHLIAQDNV